MNPPPQQLPALDWQTQLPGWQARALRAGHRLLLVLSGSPDWCQRQLAGLPPLNGPGLWLDATGQGPDARPFKAATQYLGRELDWLVFDTRQGFSPDAFGAVCGSLRAGGLLLLLTPPLADWPMQAGANPYVSGNSGFIQRLAQLLRDSEDRLLVQEGRGLLIGGDLFSAPPWSALSVPAPYRSADQQLAVQAIVRHAREHAPPLVLLADRGRGKSAALGLAAAQLLQEAPGRILLTAPRPGACAGVFELARAGLGQAAPREPHVLQGPGGSLEFIAPDRLLAEHPAARLLLVDEAAAIPLPLLKAMLAQYPRLVLATTVHGYEGSGGGFALRFQPVLDQRAPGWRSLTLHTPIRWAAADPLERFVYQALLLNCANPAPALEAAVIDRPIDDCRFERLDPGQLLDDEPLLRELFGLLVLAHYRTTPDDLQQLLDAPGLRIHLLRWQQQILGVALLGLEGGFEPAMAEAIYLGRRRPPGHLLAQTLAFHAGVPAAAQARYARVMRLAVHPAWQGRGLGSRLLKHLVQDAVALDVAAIGASFGASAELMRFWERQGFEPVRLGLSREASSGQPALVMLRGLSDTGHAVQQQARQRFINHLPTLLADPLRDLEPALAAQLCAGLPTQHDEHLTAQDWQDLDSFAHGRRGYELCAWPIEKLSRQLQAQHGLWQALSPQHQALLQLRAVEKLAWPEFVERLNLAGKKPAIALLRHAVAQACELARTTPGALP